MTRARQLAEQRMYDTGFIHVSDVEALILQAQREDRERCAREAEGPAHDTCQHPLCAAERCAAARIRSLGDAPAK